MSRIDKQPVAIPSGVEARLEGNLLKFKKGNLAKESGARADINVEIKDNNTLFSPKGEDRQNRVYWGTYGALAYSVVVSLTQGFSKTLEIDGVGYEAALKSKVLELSLGSSHPIGYDIPEGIEITVDKNNVIIKGSDKQVVGQVAAQIHEFRSPESYKGKGVGYSNERIIHEAGKASKK